MTREMMIAAIEALGDDASLFVDSEGTLCVTIEDFEGFDDDWEEIEREFDNLEAVESFLDMLEEECISKDGDFYHYYNFEGFTVQLGYSSYDI